MVPILYEKLELLTNVMHPNDVKVWRVYCLQSLAKTVFKEDRIRVINELLNIVQSQFTDNLIHAKVNFSIYFHIFNCAPVYTYKYLFIVMYYYVFSY